jgi:hypothetical protein
MKEFMYVFQISKLITFEVNFYTLGTNSAPYFSTSANEFCRSKLDYTRGGQAQRDLLPKFSPARRFFEKWDHCHLHDLTPAEYEEIAADIEELKKKDPHALKNLPVGAVIRFTLHTGESIELLKHAAAYQFKRPFWFCQSSGRYMPATRIPANYEVVTA